MRIWVVSVVVALGARGTAQAQQRDAGITQSVQTVTTDASVGPALNTFDLPMVQRGNGVVTHYPIPEQLAHQDVPVFVQVRSVAPIDHVSLFYRGPGAPRYREIRMVSMGRDLALPGGFGANIPCEDVFPPRIQYYVEAVATSGIAVGAAGSAGRPIDLPIVPRRTRAFVPTLPGQPPPRSCSNSTTTASSGSSSLDAGAVPSTGTADLGEPCRVDGDCRHDLRCGSSHRCIFPRPP